MFHVTGGLYFERLDDSGSVRIVRHATASIDSPVVFEQVLSAFDWMSVVDAVSYNPGATAMALANEIHRGIGSGV